MEFIENWFKTAREVVLRPKEFFSKMPTTGGLGEPFRFALINIFLSALIYVGFMVYKLSSTPELQMQFQAIIEWLGVDVYGLAIIALSIIIVMGTISIFVSTAILHLFLKIVGAKNTYEATFRIFAYLTVFNVISMVSVVDNIGTTIIGVLISFYVIYLAITTIRDVHEITILRTIIAYVLLFVVAMIVVVIITLIVSAIAYMWIMSVQEQIAGDVASNIQNMDLPMQANVIADLLK